MAPLEVLAAWHLDPGTRRISSSGGVFSALAEATIEQGGVVVGAAFDDSLAVGHISVERLADLHLLRGSKYVQSTLSAATYRTIRDCLRNGRKVLFSGTPCQAAGLRKYLGVADPNLYVCDLICHGVPSPRVWSAYMDYCGEQRRRVTKVAFRDKKTGWKDFSIRKDYSDGRTRYSPLGRDPYFQAFVRNLDLREACYRCAFASLCRVGDVTIGDYWGAQHDRVEFDRDDRGTSVVLVNTQVGREAIEGCRNQLFCAPAALDCVIKGNPMLDHPAPRPLLRSSFYRDLARMPFSSVIRKYRLARPMWRRVGSWIKRAIVKTAGTVGTWAAQLSSCAYLGHAIRSRGSEKQ